jgi:hypothetical protein
VDADLKSGPGIVRSTDHYDSWLVALEPVFAHDLKQKLKVMAGEPGDFLRATFYRWSERFPDVCLEVTFRSRGAGGRRCAYPPALARPDAAHVLPR